MGEVNPSGAGRMTDPGAVIEFVTCEKSTRTGAAAFFTLVSAATRKRFTFKAAPPKKERADAKGRTLFLSLLTGSDNTNDYTYMGLLWQPMPKRPWFFRHTKASKIGPDATSARAFTMFWKELMKPPRIRPPNLLEVIEFWHAGRCGRCGQLLTRDSAIADGFGEDCLGKMGRQESLFPR